MKRILLTAMALALTAAVLAQTEEDSTKSGATLSEKTWKAGDTIPIGWPNVKKGVSDKLARAQKMADALSGTESTGSPGDTGGSSGGTAAKSDENENTCYMKEISYKDMLFNPFTLIGEEWMLVTAGTEEGFNTMTASWGQLGCQWGHNDPVAVIYIRPSRYTKTFVDAEDYFTLCVFDKTYKKRLAYLGSVSGRDEDKVAKAGLSPVHADGTTYFAEAKLVLICRKLYAAELQESGFVYDETIEQSYPLRDYHTMYVGKIERILVRDDEYLKK